MNEPADPHPHHTGLISIYDRTYAAIHDIDPNHILFLDGNTFATDFTKFPEDSATRWGSNVAFAIHDYSTFGFPNSPEAYEGTNDQKDKMKASYARKRKWMDERGLCVWNGEWGPVYGREVYDGEQTEDINRRRYMVLKDQLETYRKVMTFGFFLIMLIQCCIPGLPQLVYLVIQRYRLPRNGICFPGYAIHEALSGVSSQEAPTCR